MKINEVVNRVVKGYFVQVRLVILIKRGIILGKKVKNIYFENRCFYPNIKKQPVVNKGQVILVSIYFVNKDLLYLLVKKELI